MSVHKASECPSLPKSNQFRRDLMMRSVGKSKLDALIPREHMPTSGTKQTVVSTVLVRFLWKGKLRFHLPRMWPAQESDAVSEDEPRESNWLTQFSEKSDRGSIEIRRILMKLLCFQMHRESP